GSRRSASWRNVDAWFEPPRSDSLPDVLERDAGDAGSRCPGARRTHPCRQPPARSRSSVLTLAIPWRRFPAKLAFPENFRADNAGKDEGRLPQPPQRWESNERFVPLVGVLDRWGDSRCG